MECKEVCKRGCGCLLLTLGFSWRTVFSTVLTCLSVPYLRISLHLSDFHIVLFFSGVAFLRIMGSCLGSCYRPSQACRPYFLFSQMLPMLICFGIRVGSSIGFSTIPFWMDVKDDALRWTILGVATLLYGLMGFSMEFSGRLGLNLEDPTLLKHMEMREKPKFVGLSLGFLVVLLLFWIQTNLLGNLHIIVGLVGGVILISVSSIFLALCLLRGTDDPYKSEAELPHTATCCDELASELEKIWECLDVKAGVVFSLYLVFRMISYSLLILAFDWYARHESDSSESSTNFYDVNGASVGLAQMFLVPIVFLLGFPFVKDFLSKYIHEFTFDWLISLVGIGTFLSLFLCFIYFQQSLFYFAFLSIGITICLLPLKPDLVEYLVSSFPLRKSVSDRTVSTVDEIRLIYRNFFRLLDLAGTLLGSVVSSIIIEFSGYPLFLRVVTFSMGFVFVALCSLPLLKPCKSCNETNSLTHATKDDPTKNEAEDHDEYEARPYLFEAGTEPKVIFKRTVTKFV